MLWALGIDRRHTPIPPRPLSRSDPKVIPHCIGQYHMCTELTRDRKDEDEVKKYNIEPGNAIHLVLALRGGRQ